MPINQAIAVTESLETVGLKWLGGIIRESALPSRARVEEGDPQSQERIFLQDAERSAYRRSIHESDSHV